MSLDENLANKRETVRNYIREHQGASVQEVMDNVGVSRKFVQDMRRSNFFNNSDKFGGRSRYPCAKCGTIITSGVYCRDCLARLRAVAKAQSERRAVMERVAAEEKIQMQHDNRILIIDNDELNLNTMKFILEKGLENYSISLTDNLISAMNILHGLKVKLIILDDAVISNYDGLRILKAIREDNLTKNIPVVMMTAEARKENIARALSMGAIDYLNKPFSPKELVERVQKDLVRKTLHTKIYTTFKILLVDEDIFDLQVEKDILSKNVPCEITVAQGGTEALWILNDNYEMDLVLLSLEMSFMDGMEVLAFIRRNEKLKNLPVIMMTASRELNFPDSTPNLSVKGYIRKPEFDSEGLALIKTTLIKKQKGG